MSAYHTASLIDDVAATSSRAEKERLIQALVATELGAFVIKWAYDPFVTFGITPALTEGGEGRLAMEFKISLIEPLLQKLALRQLTGNAAEREISEVMACLNKDSARLLFLILSKDLKCGIAETTINAAVPGMIPVFSVMRAHAYEPKRMKKTMKAEFKLDGQRNTFLCKDGNGGFFTRSGKRVPALDFMVRPVIAAAAWAAQKNPELRKLMLGDRPGSISSLNFMLDGEAMMGLFEDTGALRRKESDAVGAELHLYDILSYDDFNAAGAVGPTLVERRKLLSSFVHLAQEALAKTPTPDLIQIVPQFFVNNDAEVQALFERSRAQTLAAYLARGDARIEAALEKTTIDRATGKPKVLEGIVVKDPDALYEKRKSYAWLKLKPEETADLRIIDAYPGEPHTKYEHALGGLSVDLNGVTVNVGGGFTDAERFQLWADFTGKSVERPYKDSDGDDHIEIHHPSGPVVGRLIEVEYMEITPDGSLRHPRFVRFRDDKDGEVEMKEAA